MIGREIAINSATALKVAFMTGSFFISGAPELARPPDRVAERRQVKPVTYTRNCMVVYLWSVVRTRIPYLNLHGRVAILRWCAALPQRFFSSPPARYRILLSPLFPTTS